MAEKKFGIFDWTGKRKFDGATRPTFQEAWEIVYEFARKELGENHTDKEYEDFIGEYYVEEV